MHEINLIVHLVFPLLMFGNSSSLEKCHTEPVRTNTCRCVFDCFLTGFRNSIRTLNAFSFILRKMMETSQLRFSLMRTFRSELSNHLFSTPVWKVPHNLLALASAYMKRCWKKCRIPLVRGLVKYYLVCGSPRLQLLLVP